MEQQQKEQERPVGERGGEGRAKTTWHKLLLRSNFVEYFSSYVFTTTFLLPFLYIIIICICCSRYIPLCKVVVVAGHCRCCLSPTFSCIFYFGIDFKIERRTFPDAGVIKFSYVLFACFLFAPQLHNMLCIYKNTRRVCVCAHEFYLFIYREFHTHTGALRTRKSPHLYFVEFLLFQLHVFHGISPCFRTFHSLTFPPRHSIRHSHPTIFRSAEQFPATRVRYVPAKERANFRDFVRSAEFVSCRAELFLFLFLLWWCEIIKVPVSIFFE